MERSTCQSSSLQAPSVVALAKAVPSSPSKVFEMRAKRSNTDSMRKMVPRLPAEIVLSSKMDQNSPVVFRRRSSTGCSTAMARRLGASASESRRAA